MERSGQECSEPGHQSQRPTPLVWQISPINAENTHPLVEKWQNCTSLKILGRKARRSQAKRTAGSPRVLGGEDREGERAERWQEMWREQQHENRGGREGGRKKREELLVDSTGRSRSDNSECWL